MTPCGCRVLWIDAVRAQVEYCPLHAAAEEMLKALKSAALAFDVYADTLNKERAVFSASHARNDAVSVRQVIARAEGKG